MISEGCTLKNIQAKVFGGGDVLGTESKIFNIGKRNINIAESILKEYKIKVTAKSLGGKNGRKILFCTHSGVVRQKYVTSKCVVK